LWQNDLSILWLNVKSHVLYKEAILLNYIAEGFSQAVKLLITFDPEVWGVIGLSLVVSFLSTIIAGALGILFGFYTGLKRFRGKRIYARILYTLMGLPPVVVGLLVAIMLARRGPFGQLQLLFTPTAMVIAQVLLVTPIVTGIVFNLAGKRGREIYDLGKTLGGGPVSILKLFVKELKTELLAALVTGFGRAVSEVGAVMIVGGNIKGHTRVMTTYIAMNNSMGNYAAALAMAIVLLSLSFMTNAFLYHVAGEDF
jgi:tungstate transport system permease protein